ncbi:MAG: sigma 54-interacting transcriptional regulator [Acidobacteriota bacterium]
MHAPKADGLETRTETSTTGAHPGPMRHALRSVPGLVILSHPEASRIGDEAPLTELHSGGSARLSRREPSFLPPVGDVAPTPLGVPFLSRRPLVFSAEADGALTLRRGESPIEVQVCGEPLGDRRRFSAEEVEDGVVLMLAKRIALLLHPVPALRSSAAPSYGLVGHSAAIEGLRREIRAVALLQVPVLLRGETGTGKELVARAVHDARPTPGPYVTVNLGALVPSLAASELFGAVRGAYTGADRQREGYFRRAHGGTLFLDEIGEAPPEVQVMLLRTLETGRVQPVGATDERAVDVRVVAATDADLDDAIRGGRFRPALLHRLGSYEIRVPPLRRRRDDIARLLVHFLDEESRRLGDAPPGPGDRGPWPPAPAVARLVEHHWPGNVRELRNVARRLAVARHLGAEGDVGAHGDPMALLDQVLAPATSGDDPDPAPTPASATLRRRPGADVDPDELVTALERAGWRPGPAAKALGLSRQALYRRIEEHPDLRTAADVPVDVLRAALERTGSATAAALELRVSPQGLKRRVTALGLDANSPD